MAVGLATGVLSLGACAGPGQPEDEQRGATAAELAALAPGTSATCTDVAGDGRPVDLLSATVAGTSTGLQATFRLAAAPASGDDLELSVSIWRDDDLPVRQLTAHLQAGGARVFSYEAAGAQVRRFPPRVTVAGPVVTVDFPPAAVEGLGRSWRWDVTAGSDHDPGDACPQGGGKYEPAPRLAYPATAQSPS
jgi:hypothetical protein